MTTKRAVITVFIAILCWGAILAGVTIFSDAAPAKIVLFPSKGFIQNLSEDIAIVDATQYSITLASDVPELALKLYQQGAWIVLPSGLAGCAGRI